MHPTIVIRRREASTILVPFASIEVACNFAILYYGMCKPSEVTCVALFEGEIWNFPLSERGTVLLTPDEALTLHGSTEPYGYLVGESESIWTRVSCTHAELDVELDAYMSETMLDE